MSVSLFGKNVESITVDDLQALITEKYPEGADVEYKETLPTKDGGQDRWIATQDRIGDYARNEVLAEVVGMANAHGGYVFLGIAETQEKPARADRLCALPKCHELAARLRDQARDCIEPKLAMVSVHGVVTDGADGGVVVFRVPESRLAPHRLVPERECFLRRNDRCEKMTMREIQDLTLLRDRGLADLENRFGERRQRFATQVRQWAANPEFDHVLATRITLLPIGGRLAVNRVFGRLVILGLTLNAILTADRIRRALGAPELEYGLEMELFRPGGSIRLSEFPKSSRSTVRVAHDNPVLLPRLSVGGREGRSSDNSSRSFART